MEIEVRIVHRLSNQSPGFDEVTGWEDGGQPIARNRLNDYLLIRLGETVRATDKPIDVLLDSLFEYAPQITLAFATADINSDV